MQTREPFTLTKRNVGKKIVYYYFAYDDQGIRHRYSTGCTAKSQAFAYSMELARSGSLIQDQAVKQKATTFEVFAKDWWTKDCEYVQSEALRGKKLSEQYIVTNYNLMIRHILPTFQKVAIREITSYMVETWMRRLVAKMHLAPKSTNNILSILSVMLEEARRQGMIRSNPCREVRAFAKNSRPRGILTQDEARRLLTTPPLWDNPIAYAASLLAAC
ncbi:MAG: phage integrase SAM-like domain-containing protein, partial [Sphaerochaetaceae bacterium]